MEGETCKYRFNAHYLSLKTRVITGHIRAVLIKTLGFLGGGETVSDSRNVKIPSRYCAETNALCSRILAANHRQADGINGLNDHSSAIKPPKQMSRIPLNLGDQRTRKWPQTTKKKNVPGGKDKVSPSCRRRGSEATTGSQTGQKSFSLFLLHFGG